MELKEKIAFYKVCFDSMQAGILVFNNERDIVLANIPISLIFEYSSEELRKFKACKLFKNCGVLKNFIIHSDKQKYKTLVELIGVKKSGQEFPVEVSFGKIEYEGKPYFKLLLTDISLRKKREKK